MNQSLRTLKKVMAVAIAATLLGACAAAPGKPDGAAEARTKLTQLQSNPQLATRAPVAIKDAELAVKAAEQPQKDKALGQHLVYLADRKVDIASARAQSRLLEDQRAGLSEQREGARLDSRTLEADLARADTQEAQANADDARRENEALQRQIAELNAKETERGLVITLGDLLFAFDRSELKSSAHAHLGKLAVFLNQYKDRTIVIEGHTDSAGSDGYNFSLSQRRADSVKMYLTGQGVASSRIQTSGKGEGSPVAENTTSTGRQQNRRVEVIIENEAN